MTLRLERCESRVAAFTIYTGTLTFQMPSTPVLLTNIFPKDDSNAFKIELLCDGSSCNLYFSHWQLGCRDHLACHTVHYKLDLRREGQTISENPINKSSRSECYECNNMSIFKCRPETVYNINFEITVEGLPLPSNPNFLYLKDVSLPDFNFPANDGNISIHKAVLAYHSPEFQKVLKRDLEGARETVWNIPGASFEDLSNFSNYLYTGKVPSENLDEMLKIASSFQIPDLISRCTSAMFEVMAAENFLRIIHFAISIDCDFLIAAALRYTKACSKDILIAKSKLRSESLISNECSLHRVYRP